MSVTVVVVSTTKTPVILGKHPKIVSVSAHLLALDFRVPLFLLLVGVTNGLISITKTIRGLVTTCGDRIHVVILTGLVLTELKPMRVFFRIRITGLLPIEVRVLNSEMNHLELSIEIKQICFLEPLSIIIIFV